MTVESDFSVAFLDGQLDEYRRLHGLLVSEAERVESGDYHTLASSCELMMQVMGRIEKSSAVTSSATSVHPKSGTSGGATDMAAHPRAGSGQQQGRGSSRSRRPDIDADPIRSRLSEIRTLIGQIESLRTGIVHGLGEARKDLVEEMNQLTAGAAATKGYYKPKSYRGPRYFDRSQ